MLVQIYHDGHMTLKDVDTIDELQMDISEVNNKFTVDSQEYYEALFSYIKEQYGVNINGYTICVNKNDSMLNHNRITLLTMFYNDNVSKYLILCSAYVLNSNGKTIKTIGV